MYLFVKPCYSYCWSVFRVNAKQISVQSVKFTSGLRQLWFCGISCVPKLKHMHWLYSVYDPSAWIFSKRWSKMEKEQEKQPKLFVSSEIIPWSERGLSFLCSTHRYSHLQQTVSTGGPKAECSHWTISSHPLIILSADILAHLLIMSILRLQICSYFM